MLNAKLAFVHVNVHAYDRTAAGQAMCYPSEMSLVEFSLRDGVFDSIRFGFRRCVVRQLSCVLFFNDL